MSELTKIDPALRDIFRLAYLYRQKYANLTGDTEQFWRNAAAEMGECVKMCHNHPFARDVFLACYADIERSYLARNSCQNG